LSIEQLFSQPECWRSGHVPEALQQHDARAGEAIMAIDGSVSARMTKAAKSRRTAGDCSSGDAAGHIFCGILQKTDAAG
jgi:hypothetical protein